MNRWELGLSDVVKNMDDLNCCQLLMERVDVKTNIINGNIQDIIRFSSSKRTDAFIFRMMKLQVIAVKMAKNGVVKDFYMNPLFANIGTVNHDLYLLFYESLNHYKPNWLVIKRN